MMSNEAWEHPVLGRVSFAEYYWRTEAKLPTFQRYKYLWSEDRPGSRTALLFDGEERPSDEAVALAVRIVEDQESFADRVRRGLWDDLVGNGPHSGMWWHGNLDDINAEAATFAPNDESALIRTIDDLNQHLGTPQVLIRESEFGSGGPIAEVTFSATFEDEHGISVLVDETGVIGLGYLGDAVPFGADE